MSNYYLGASRPTIEQVLGDNPRFFYALRRNDDGELYFVRVDQLFGKDIIEVNSPGEIGENIPDFEQGFDFFEGIDVDHNIVYENLQLPQYRWDSILFFYYIDEQGQFVARINQSYTYPDQVSS